MKDVTRSYRILLYHGVHPDGLSWGLANSSGKHIPRERFAAEMECLARSRPVVTMRDIAAAHRGESTLPDGAVAVTFDDGFLNNRTEAWPVLERYGIPATIYLATGYIGSGKMMWTDRLEAAILGTQGRRLDVDVAGVRLNYDLREDTGRVAAFTEIKARCKSSPNDMKDAVVDWIWEELGPDVAPDDPRYAFMNWDDARTMAKSELIEFGAHTVDHVALSRVPNEVMRSQIDLSVEAVNNELGIATPFFSYPEGQESDYNDDVIGYLREKGFDHAPSAIDGVNYVATTDPFHIRRTMVGFEGRPFPFPLA